MQCQGNFSHRIRPLLVLCDTLALEVGNGLPDTDCRQRKDPAQVRVTTTSRIFLLGCDAWLDVLYDILIF
jgi:hypothetical protein